MLITSRIYSAAILLAVFAGGWSTSLRGIDDRLSGPARLPTLMHTCLISDNVRRLVSFYEPILGEKAKWSGEDYAEFPTDAGVLAIFSAEAQEKYIPGSTEAARNKSMILEFRVGDADQEYRRLQGLVNVWVKPPTTQRWGTRSLYFRDPDGNLVDFYVESKTR
ncbi:MAG: VOC family protein [Terracidiphilus sp.]|jgi:catechol 2,3-dioxygenase-like lactoylglutathione lyase family enzyme